MNSKDRDRIPAWGESKETNLMVTEEVIKEIYKKYRKPPKERSELELGRFLPIIEEHHDITCDDMECVLNGLEEFNPFRRFLWRGVHAILEFEKVIAIVFKNHILFLGKDDNSLRVHFKPEDKGNIFSRIFGK